MITQEDTICLLDKPTNHLDPYFQQAILVKCKELIAKGISVVTAPSAYQMVTSFFTFILRINITNT